MKNPDQKFEKYMQCPFYEASGNLFVRCEGLVPGTSLKNCFRNYNACRKFKTVHCASLSGYHSCPVTEAMLKTKYAEETNSEGRQTMP